MTLLRQVLQGTRAGRPGAGLGSGPAGKSQLAEQDVAELLRAARVERLAGERLDLDLERERAVPELVRELRQHLAVDGNAAPLHAREHRNERPLQRFVDCGHALGGQPRLEHLPQPQRDVGILGGVFGRLGDIDAVERDLGFSSAGDLIVIDGRVIEIALGERLETVIGTPGIEHVGHQHGVVARRKADAAQGEYLQVEFEVLADLEHAGVFEQRLHRRERCALLDLIWRD